VVSGAAIGERDGMTLVVDLSQGGAAKFHYTDEDNAYDDGDGEEDDSIDVDTGPQGQNAVTPSLETNRPNRGVMLGGALFAPPYVRRIISLRIILGGESVR
jgi:hypothetical protein